MKISKIILPIVLLIACSLPSMAQTQYEYAVVTFYPFAKKLEVSINGIEYKEIDVEKEEVKGFGDVNRAIKEVNIMSNEGWNVFEANTTIPGSGNSNAKIYTFYLRREKK